jgi:perosamine synthetase
VVDIIGTSAKGLPARWREMKIVSNKPTITRKELEAVLDCLINDELVAGDSVRTFESTMAHLIGLKHALAVNSLTAAYHLAFLALGIGPGDEVIMPSFFQRPALSALGMTGGKAVLVDSEKEAIFPASRDLLSQVNEKTRAIVIAHLFGYHFPVTELMESGIPVIEDISHSVGTEMDDIPCGRNGAISVASFNPCGIITTGNGGMMLTNNSKYYSTMKEYRGNGEERLHFEYTMTDFQGAMGITQLARLPELLNRRREIARIYHDSLKITPHKAPYLFNDRFAYQAFPVVFSATNDKIEGFWRKNRIEVLRPVGHPLHQFLELGGSAFPNSERFSKKLFTIPLYPTLTRKDVEKISKTLASFI